MDKKYEEAKEKLKEYKQEHLLIWYDKMIEQKREELLNQILNIDFSEINALYKQTQTKKDFKDCKIEPISYIDKQKLSKQERDQYEACGKKRNTRRKICSSNNGRRTRNKITDIVVQKELLN